MGTLAEELTNADHSHRRTDANEWERFYAAVADGSRPAVGIRSGRGGRR